MLAERPQVEAYDFFLSCPRANDNHRQVVRVERQSGETTVVAAYGGADVRTSIDASYGKSYASLGTHLYAHDLMVGM